MPLVLVSGHAEDFKECDPWPHPTAAHLSIPSLSKASSMQELVAYVDAFCQVDPATNLWPHLAPFLPLLLDARILMDPPSDGSEVAPTWCSLVSSMEPSDAAARAAAPSEIERHAGSSGCAVASRWSVPSVRDEWLSMRPRALAHVESQWRREVACFLSAGGALGPPDGGAALAADGSVLAVHPNLRAFVHEVATNGGAVGPPPACELRMENVVGGMQWPCVLDLKLGRVRYHPCTPLGKRQKILSQEGNPESTVFQCGVRICGAQHYCEAAGCSDPELAIASPPFEVETLPKAYGHRNVRSQAALRRAILRFLSPARMLEDPCPQTDAACAQPTDSHATVAFALQRYVQQRLTELLSTLVAHKALLEDTTCLTSCSVLVTYDAAVWADAAKHLDAGTDLAAFCRRAPDTYRCRVHLIDLARCGRRDFNYSEDTVRFLDSLVNLIRLLDR